MPELYPHTHGNYTITTCQLRKISVRKISGMYHSLKSSKLTYRGNKNEKKGTEHPGAMQQYWVV